ncbi:MAG TPA: polymer-forming cytoskeletal protein [Burkholderiaceae bacterium]|nr:polymer-forming cytoskeletal protein [Burkholderiaceae bacterium]
MAALCAAPVVARAAGGESRVSWSQDVFVAGGSPSVREPVDGNLFAAGGRVDIDAPVAGDVVAAGGRLQLDGAVGESLQAAAGQLFIGGKVGHDARVAGGQVEFGPSSAVGGSVAVAGGHVRLLGTIAGDVRAAGGRLLIDGTVGGDVISAAGDVELGPNARITGALRHRGGNLQRDPAAQVAGGIQSAWPFWSGAREAPARGHRNGAAIGWGWTVALAALAALLLAVSPRFQARVTATLRQQPGLSLLLGALWLVCAPLLLLVLLLTVIAIPLTLLGAALYVVLLPVAYVSTAIALGHAALRALRADAAPSWAWQTASAALVLAALSQAPRLPRLGAAIVALVLIAGLGALALQLRRRSPTA